MLASPIPKDLSPLTTPGGLATGLGTLAATASATASAAASAKVSATASAQLAAALRLGLPPFPIPALDLGKLEAVA